MGAIRDKTTCTRCKQAARRPGQRWCLSCRNEWMREHRPSHSTMPDEARRKANARSYLNVYIRRGVIERGPCASCGSTQDVQGHHEDYSKPLDVVWLCRSCHKLHHRILEIIARR